MTAVPARVLMDRQYAASNLVGWQPLPEGLYDDPPRLLDWLAGPPGTERTVIVGDVWDLGGSLPHAPGAVHGDGDRPWVTYRWSSRGQQRVLHLGFWDRMRQAPKDHPLFTELLAGVSSWNGSAASATSTPAGPDRILRLLNQWQTFWGGPWHGQPGVMGCDLLRTAHDQLRQPLWHHAAPVNSGERAYSSWDNPDQAGLRSRPLDSTDRVGVSVIDSNRSYLAAAVTVELAAGGLVHHAPPTGDLVGMPGWYLVEADPWPAHLARLLPDPLGRPVAGDTHPVWVTYPTVRLLEQLQEGLLRVVAPYGVGYTIREAWLAPGRRITRRWAEQLRARIDAFGPDHPIHHASKACYKQAWGLWNREGGSIYRPDWHYAVMAQARTALWRKIALAGQDTGKWPLFIRTDAVGYYGAIPECDHIRIGDRLGQFRRVQ